MIHQYIFAAPKPGMTEEEFQDYWLNNHAVNFAAKIPQIVKYKLDLRTPAQLDNGEPFFSGIAEIWLNNDEEQIASLQTPQFLKGAREDEPNWAAFWKTLVLDTELAYDSGNDTKDTTGIKAVIIAKRKNGLELEDFRNIAVSFFKDSLKDTPSIRRFSVNLVRDGWYFLGEPRFDLVLNMWFENEAALNEVLKAERFKNIRDGENAFIEEKYWFPFFVKEHWIIGPEFRS